MLTTLRRSFIRAASTSYLFVWPYREKELTSGSSGSREGYNWVNWQSGAMRFCLVSDAALSDLDELKDLIRR